MSTQRLTTEVCDAWPLQRQTYGYLPNRKASLPLDRYQVYCLVTKAHVCEQLAQGCYLKAEWPGIEPAAFGVAGPTP